MKLRAFATGAVAFALLLALYFLLVGLVSGFEYALEQFATYWYFLVALAAGFGAQMGLYTYLKRLVANSSASKKVVAVSGTTSTAAMISCCAHYLTNILPVLGATGLVTIAAQYQVEFFWVGLAFNLAGIAYIVPKVIRASKEHARCAVPRLTLARGGAVVVVLLALGLPSAPARAAEPAPLPSRTSNEQMVTVKVTPHDLAAKSWEFDLVLDTHVRPLDDDLMKSAVLLDAAGGRHAPLAWRGDGPGGHHRKGILVFAPLEPRPPAIELQLQRAGEAAPRIFKWQLP